MDPVVFSFLTLYIRTVKKVVKRTLTVQDQKLLIQNTVYALIFL